MSVSEDNRGHSDDEGVDGSDQGSATDNSKGLQATPPRQADAACSSTSFHRDIDRWKDLYEACQAKLESLRDLQAQIEDSSDMRSEACEARRCWEELRAEVQAATQTLEQEHALVERALEKHGAVLGQLLRRLHARDATSASRLQLQVQAEASDTSMQLPRAQSSSEDKTNETEASPPSSPSAPSQPTTLSKETIALIKELIREHEILSAGVEQGRVKLRGKSSYSKECLSVAAMRATEEKLHRTSGLLQHQVKRLQYELSRLTQAQGVEMAAVAKLQEQAAAELELSLAHAESLDRTRQQLQDGARLLASPRDGGQQELYRHGSRSSFVDGLEHGQRRKERRDRLEGRLYSDRVYREVDQLDEQAGELQRLGERLTTEIEDMSEACRALESTWLSLRQDRDELTAHLHPDLQRLQELQEIAKEKLELESKLQKEHFAFKQRLEEFQRDLLEVETDLLTGNTNKKARATKNIVDQLLVLRDCIMAQNNELWGELRDKHLTISSTDSLASAAMGEDEFRQFITDKMKKMELRIKEDLDRRALFGPKKFVLEAPAPSASKPFPAQRNVIRVQSKAAADWRKKTTVEINRQEALDRQVENLRRDILNKLSQEKEKAKQQLLQYESQRLEGSASAASTAEDVKASQELRPILAQLDAFLQRSRRGKDREASAYVLQQAAPESEEDDFGREMRILVLQLEKLQAALEGSKDRERERKATALERGGELFDQLSDADAEDQDPSR